MDGADYTTLHVDECSGSAAYHYTSILYLSDPASDFQGGDLVFVDPPAHAVSLTLSLALALALSRSLALSLFLSVYMYIHVYIFIYTCIFKYIYPSRRRRIRHRACKAWPNCLSLCPPPRAPFCSLPWVIPGAAHVRACMCARACVHVSTWQVF